MSQSYRLYQITSKNTDATIIFRCQFDNFHATQWLVNLAVLPLDFENEIISYVRKFKDFQLYRVDSIFNEGGAVKINNLRTELEVLRYQKNFDGSWFFPHIDAVPCRTSAKYDWMSTVDLKNDPILPNEIFYLNSSGFAMELKEKDCDSDRAMLRHFLESYMKIKTTAEKRAQLWGMA